MLHFSVKVGERAGKAIIGSGVRDHGSHRVGQVRCRANCLRQERAVHHVSRGLPRDARSLPGVRKILQVGNYPCQIVRKSWIVAISARPLPPPPTDTLPERGRLWKLSRFG